MKLPTYTDFDVLVSVLGVRAGIIPLGALAGLPAVFVDMAGCNLWDGRLHARDEASSCCARACHTRVAGGQVTSWADVMITAQSAGLPAQSWLVLGGGEPAQQLVPDMVAGPRALGWQVAVETNGTLVCPALAWADHVILSPKPDVPVLLSPDAVDELRVVLPGSEVMAEAWTDARLDVLADTYPTAACFLVPCDLPLDPNVAGTVLEPGGQDLGEVADLAYAQVVARCVRYVAARGRRWRLGLETNKVFPLGLS